MYLLDLANDRMLAVAISSILTVGMLYVSGELSLGVALKWEFRFLVSGVLWLLLYTIPRAITKGM